MLQSLAMGVVDGIDGFACDCSLSPKSLVYHRTQFYLDLGGHWNSLGAQCHHAKQVMDQDVPQYEYAVKVGDLQWVRIPPGQSVARPEATRAANEVTTFVEVLWV